MCVNKMAFEAKADAMAWLKRSSKKSEKPRIYQCECGKFHFTSGTKADDRRWRKRLRKAK